MFNQTQPIKTRRNLNIETERSKRNQRKKKSIINKDIYIHIYTYMQRERGGNTWRSSRRTESALESSRVWSRYRIWFDAVDENFNMVASYWIPRVKGLHRERERETEFVRRRLGEGIRRFEGMENRRETERKGEVLRLRVFYRVRTTGLVV